jgi:dUTP pyrophosphatase
MKIKIKKLHPDAIIPKYAHPGDAGMDIYSVSVEVKDKYVEYKTGLSFELPENYVMLVFPRSSITDKDLIMKNCVGVLDSGFRGELKLRFKKDGENIYNIGDKIAQLIIIPYPSIEFDEVNELSESLRGEGSFGSTGIK